MIKRAKIGQNKLTILFSLWESLSAGICAGLTRFGPKNHKNKKVIEHFTRAWDK